MNPVAATDCSAAAGAEQDALLLARQALDDSPEYMAHITQLFDSCSQHLRTGADRRAMAALARATDDLHQFTLLIDMVTGITAAPPTSQRDGFRKQLDSCLRGLESALVADDLIAVSDHIEQDLLPLLPRWGAIATELAAWFEQPRGQA